MRTLLKERRAAFVAALSPDEYANAGLVIADHVMPHIAGGRTVAIYFPIGDEIDTLPLAMQLAATGATIALPHVTQRTQPMRFLEWRPDTPLVPGPFGLGQPDPSAAEVVPEVILTPLLGFDAALHRIGYGAGYYDRAFAAFPDARRIGLAWSMQIIEQIPVDPWDVPLHAVATEQGWIKA